MMRLARSIHAGGFSLIVGFGSLGLLGGCGEAKTGGTQVQQSEQQKKEMEDMDAIYRKERAGQK